MVLRNLCGHEPRGVVAIPMAGVVLLPAGDGTVGRDHMILLALLSPCPSPATKRNSEQGSSCMMHLGNLCVTLGEPCYEEEREQQHEYLTVCTRRAHSARSSVVGAVAVRHLCRVLSSR